jgi:uncharacterized protein (DUF2267 family)
MDYDHFLGQVQHRLELSSTGEAVRVTRAVLTTLGERLQEGEARDLAGPLPMEIDRYLLTADSGQRFDFDEFVDRVAERGHADRSEAVYRAQVLVALLSEVVPGGEMQQVRDQLPAGFDPLFGLIDEESTA